jgi:uncharacterized protein
MPFIIDGHNLIPKIHGLDLAQIDDELALINILENYFKIIRKKADVYFDNASPGGTQNLEKGFLNVHFTRRPMTADTAILNAVRELGRSAPNYTIVTSDQRIKNSVQRMGAQIISSAEFAMELTNISKSSSGNTSDQPDDIDYWLKVFGKNS